MRKTILISLLAVVMMISITVSAAAGGKKEPPPAPAEREVDSRLPQFVRDALKNAPEDALVGIGTANMRSLSQSMTMARTRARADISRSLNTMMMEMITDYTANSEFDHSAALAFQEEIRVALSKSELRGAVVVEEDIDANNNYWSVVMLSKTTAVNELDQAMAAAKLAVPAAAALDAQGRMTEMMNQVYEQYIPPAIGVSDR